MIIDFAYGNELHVNYYCATLFLNIGYIELLYNGEPDKDGLDIFT